MLLENRSPAEIFIARHCKTEWNTEGRLQGTQDLPLSDEGKKQAESILGYLKSFSFNRIISSDNSRAYQTARIYAKYLTIPLHTHEGLRELGHGKWEGERIVDLLENDNTGYKQWLDNPLSINIPSGTETIESAQQRITEAVKEISEIYTGEKILLISHKHIRALLYLSLKGLPFTEFKNQISEEIIPVEINF